MGPRTITAQLPCACGRQGCVSQNRHAFPAVTYRQRASVRARVFLATAPWSRRHFWTWHPVLNGRELNFLVWREGHYDTLPQAWAAARRYTQGADL